MGFRINANPISDLARRKLEGINRDSEKESIRLATGDKIYRAAYDPTGLAISEKLNYQVRSFYAAEKNANESISMFQVAEGALASIQDMSARMKELALQSANDTMGSEERAMTNAEFQNLKREVKRIMESTRYNDQRLLDGKNREYDIQVGIHHKGKEGRLNYNLSDVLKSADQMSMYGANTNTKEAALDSLPALDKMLHDVSRGRAVLGAMANRVESSIQNIQVAKEELSSSKSKIRDTDVAETVTNKAILDIRQDSTTAWLAAANVSPKKAEKLL